MRTRKQYVQKFTYKWKENFEWVDNIGGETM